MKLLSPTATQALFNDTRIYATVGLPPSSGTIGIAKQSTKSSLRYRGKEAEVTGLNLFGCTRPVNPPVANQIATHCYLSVTDNNGKQVSTLAFNPEGALQPDFSESLPEAPHTRCTLVGKISATEWGMMKEHFKSCQRKGYWLTTNNCCTCAAEALDVIGKGHQVARSFEDANYVQGKGKEKVA